jgi:AICAR transformylase/IMP cyclohydrolase PurH
LRYIFGLIYERLLDMGKHVDANANVLLETVGAFQNIVGLNEILSDRVKTLHDVIKGRDKGVSVESVPITNED